MGLQDEIPAPGNKRPKWVRRGAVRPDWQQRVIDLTERREATRRAERATYDQPDPTVRPPGYGDIE